jgi:aspartyl-tRNA(Asn)/glutamyl-tRNA(Gln) amidotransferase subunit B
VEEDAGKSLHDRFPKRTAIDLNRCGVPLAEIVTGPDFRSPPEARAYLLALKQVLEYAGVSDCDMEKGSLRVDANVSVRRTGASSLGTKTEVKNINSFAYVEKALTVERDRQIALLEGGGSVAQQTMLYDAKTNGVRPQRTKEESHDYRYFPDPDLLPLVLEPEWIERLRADLPELPDAKKARFVAEYGLRAEDAAVLVAERATADYFECVAAGRDPKAAANWVMGDLFGALNRLGLGIDASPVAPEALGTLIDLVADGTISGRIAKDVFAEMVESGAAPGAIVAAKGLHQLSDAGAIADAVDAAIAAHPAQVSLYKANPKVLGFFVGQVMKATRGRANPALVNQMLRQKLD